jgi:hypothetical protein
MSLLMKCDFSKHKRAKEKIETARTHSKLRRFVDANDDAGLIMDQYRSLDTSIRETMVCVPANFWVEWQRPKIFLAWSHLVNRIQAGCESAIFNLRS